MPSRAEARAIAEPLARVAAVVLLAVALWRVLLALAGAAAPAVHLALDGSERAGTRDSLAALARSGVRVSWSGEIAPMAAMVEPVREPTGGSRLSVISPRGVVIADSLGAIDSLAAGGGTLIASAIRGSVGAHSGATVARVVAAEPGTLGRVLVIGRVGWESKFVLAALEEAGWETDARLRLADTIEVATSGGSIANALRADRYAAVVVLDGSAAASAGALMRFVEGGGGLVLSADGASLTGFRAIAPARVMRTEPPRSRSFAGVDPMLALPLGVLGDLRDDAVVLDRHEGRVSVAARRVGAGRVLQSGFGETWRWRMEGDAGGAEAHRAYWSRLVGRVVATPAASAANGESGEGAPLAAMIAALGPPTTGAPATRLATSPLPLWLAALILALLTAEWASRRTRGLR